MSDDNSDEKVLYFFMYTNDKGKRRQTTYRLSLQQAAERFAGRNPEPILSTKEVRRNYGSLNTGRFMRPKL